MRDKLFIDNLSTLIRKDKGEFIMRKKILLTTVVSASLLLAACGSSTVSVKNEPVTLSVTTEKTHVIESESEDKMVETTAAYVAEETTATAEETTAEETTAAEQGELKAYQQDCFNGIKYDYDYNDDGSTIPLSKSFRAYLDSIGWEITVVTERGGYIEALGDSVYCDGYGFNISANDDNDEAITEDVLYDIMKHVGDEFGITVTDESFDWRTYWRNNKNPYGIDMLDDMEEFVESPKVLGVNILHANITVMQDFMFADLLNPYSNYCKYKVTFSIDKNGNPYGDVGFQG